MDLESDFIFDDITNVAYPLLREWCSKDMSEKVVESWLELERS